MGASGSALVLVALQLLALASAGQIVAEKVTWAMRGERALNMTWEAALEAVGHSFKGGAAINEQLMDLDFFQSSLASEHRPRHHRRLRSHSHLQSSSQVSVQVDNQEQSATGGVGQAKVKLNGMIQEATKKKDLEEVKCSEFFRRQAELEVQTRADISLYNGQAANARALILQAMTTVAMIDVKLPQLRWSLATDQEKCRTDKTAIKEQLVIVKADLHVMEAILNLTDCSKASFLQCDYHRQLQSQEARDGLQLALAQGAAAPMPGQVNTSDAPDPDKQKKKCVVSKGPDCIKLRDQFIHIQADIEDKQADLEADLSKTNAQCETNKKNFELQIDDFQTRLKSTQKKLADATEVQNQAEEQSRLKGDQLKTLFKERIKETIRCREAFNSNENELCGLVKIRQELLKLSSSTEVVVDCEVSMWDAGDCSVTCGGGVQQLSRSVLTAPQGGASCPPLTMERRCSTDGCPVDCKVAQWTGWSDCSAECGGGVMQRVRKVILQDQNGGKGCGETSQTESCNLQSCDEDCVLKQWTSWSPCSKVCDGGFQESKRHVAQRAKGQGFCPSEDSMKRLKYKPCNEQPCVPKYGTLHCQAKLDVTIVLDGSGSLGATGWAASVEFAKMLVSAFEGGEASAQTSLLLFSGPRSYWDRRKCILGRLSGERCGVKWVSHYSKDTAGLVTKVGALAWPKGTTMTHTALGMAESEVKNGRSDAQSIVIVITDGRPTGGKRRTFQAAARLRRKARLMFVAVKRAPIRDIKRWVSSPVHDNLIEVKDFTTLKKPATITNIVADACPSKTV